MQHFNHESAPHRSMLLIAYYCGLTPLVAGLTIFLLWCVTGNRMLELLGIVNIIVGFVLFWIGMLGLCMYCWQSTEDRRAGRSLAASFLALVILFLNFPVCGMILYSVDNIQRGNRAREILERPVIQVHNETGGQITKLDVPGAGLTATTLSEGGTITLDVRDPIPEDMTLTAMQGTKPIRFNFQLPRRGRGPCPRIVVVLLPNGQTMSALPCHNLVSTIDQRNIIAGNEVSPTY